ncbi:tRNA wybutosine-synthesizing protein 2 homolog isoform X1 [Cygnus atratus]|uniref:tRNA wybutosine-synthesizing protein 2 homolog isoform X1 n=1 Tax=Cygnus atratus TaxID=8868 RepID=UPI0015D59B61|nr:tRNA wybutosine-synthesizing protein 2 homolog isoform X1 [Cygnus atratus]
MAAGDRGGTVLALATEPRFAQRLRRYLEEERLLDARYRLQKVPGGSVALPVLEAKLAEQRLRALRESGPLGLPCRLLRIQSPIPSKAASVRTPAQKLRSELQRMVLGLGESWSEELERDVPRSWQRHGDLVLLSEDSFSAALWTKLGSALWETVASALGAQRLARRGRVLPGGMRSPSVTLLLGQDGWVEHVDNGIRYTFDVTKCMFSPGNITEKLRVASLPCAGEVLVDLYAGIGYFTLPYLVHAAAAFAHACEWNHHAVEALRRNLALNGVQDRCHIHHGDNRQLRLQDVADRVNLGLIPSSEEGWPVACRVLKKGTGGVLHIHHNVEALPAPPCLQPAVPRNEQRPPEDSSSGERELQSPEEMEGSGKEMPAARVRPEWQRWAEASAAWIRGLLEELHGQPWRTSILHIEAVKSYAPHVHHIVLDLECRPALPA